MGSEEDMTLEFAILRFERTELYCRDMVNYLKTTQDLSILNDDMLVAQEKLKKWRESK